MFMENLVMTTTLTIDELDVPVTASAFACMSMCVDGGGPEELDESPALTATCFCEPCHGY
jgi:hypothetical protein